MTQQERRAWLVVVTLFTTIFFVLGATTTAIPFYFPPLIAIFHWNRTQVSLLSTSLSFAMGFSSPMAGWLLDRFDASLVMAGGAVLTGAGLLAAGRANSLTGMIVAYLVIGIGAGSSTLIPASVVATNWFSARRGLALGATLAGASANAIVMPLIINHMILAHGYRSAYRLSAVAVLLGVVPLVLLVVRTRPPEVSDSPSVTEAAPVAGLELGPAVRSAAFWLLVILNFGAGTAVGGYYYHSVPFLIGVGYSQTTCAMLVSIGAIIGVGGFFAIGMLADRFGPRPTLCGAMLGLGIAIAIAPLLRYWPLAIPVFAVFITLFGLTAGAAGIVGPMLVAETFGLRRFGSLSGLLAFPGFVGLGVGPVIVGRIFDLTSTYTPGFFAIVFVCLVAAAAVAAVSPAIGHDLAPQVAV